MADKDAFSVPSWDGSAKSWRRYTREVSWYFRATPISKRRYVATKLLSRLTGPARLLAMSWSDMALDEYDGTKVLLQRLAASPLVRRSIPNASAICGQYFGFQRKPHEAMTSFLVREALGYSEFVEALVRLAEEKRGVKQEDKDFGLPPEEPDYEDGYDYNQDYDWSSWHAWGEWPLDDENVEQPEEGDFDPNAPTAQPTSLPSASTRAAAESGSPQHGGYHRVPQDISPSRRSAGVQPSQSGLADDLSDLSFADSFVLGVLRGFRLLQSAGLSAEERRDILSATHGSLDFEEVSRALQTLWDEQFIGARAQVSHVSNWHEMAVVEDPEPHHDDWSWDVFQAEWQGDDWPSWDWSEDMQPPSSGKGRGPCFICNGPHLSRECPDRRHPGPFKGKGKFKHHYMTEYDPYMMEDFMMGKKGGKKGKQSHWMEAQAWHKGKGSSTRFKGKGPSPRPPVNAYNSEVFFGGLEMQAQEAGAPQPAPSLPATHGLLDCGATASAGPQLAVENLVSAILAKDSKAVIQVRKDDSLSIRRPLIALAMSRNRAALTEKEGNLIWDIRGGTADLRERLTGSPDKQEPRPFDEGRAVGPDNRDPRWSPDQWPCYGEHIEDTWKANPHAKYLHCATCNLRLRYVPRHGSHGQSSKVQNPTMILRMLTTLKERMNSARPSAAICLAMEKAIDAEETLSTLIGRQMIALDKEKEREKDIKGYKTAPPSKGASKSKAAPSSLTSSWDVVPTTPPSPHKDPRKKTFRELDLEDLLKEEEMQQLMKLLEEHDHILKYHIAPAEIYGCAAAPHGYNIDDRYGIHNYELPDGWKGRRLWFSLPCTKWCRWSHLNYRTEEGRAQLEKYRRRERRMLWMAAHFIEEILNEDEEVDIYFEWPWPCEGWNQHPIEYIHKILANHGREWLPCRIDGCNYGLRASDESGGFLKKQWRVMTTNEQFHSKFKCKVCPGGHSHTWIQGIETAKSSYYPWRLCKSIALAWRQEYVSDRNLKLVFAQEDQPEMITLEEELHHLEELPHVLPALQAEPSSSSSSLSPSKEELQKWQARLSHFHKAAGHPTARNLARLVRDAGCPAWKVQSALEHQCETCKSLKLCGTSSGQIPPAATHPLPGAWECIGLDTAEWLVPGQQKKARFILIIDLATKLRAVKLIKEYPELAMQPESSEEIIEGLVHGWLAHFPKPKLIVADNAKSFVSARFHELCEAENIQLHFPPEKEPWSHGIVEAAIADIKHVASAIQLEALDNTPALSLTLAASALNGTEFTAGYSAHQWAFGARYAISDEDIRVWNAIDPKEDFLRISKARAEAEEIARRSRAKRVMSKLTNTTVKQPLRTYSPTDLVMIWEYQDITNEEPTDRDRELPDLPPEPNATTLAPIRRAVGKSTLQPSDYKVVKTHLKPDYKSTHRSSPIGQVREAPKPQRYLPQPEIPMADYTPTEPPDPGELQERMDDVVDKSEAVNDYDNPDLEAPEAKKAKLDHRTEYDLKWLEQLHAEAQQEVTHEDLFTFLQSYEGDCLHIELDLNFKDRRDRRNFQLDPVLYLTKKLNSAEVSLKALGPDDLILFTRAKAIINECRAQATCLEFSRFDDCESWDQVVFVGMGDQAHSNREKGGSTGGMVILASSPKCLDGAVSKMSLLAWRTWKLKRLAVGSNDAEVQSILETEDVLFRSRVLWAELHGAGKHVASTRGFDMVDAMEAVARLVRGAHRLKSWLWAIAFDASFTAAKKNKRQGRTAVKKIDDFESSGVQLALKLSELIVKACMQGQA
ncbi:unnamed protein product [Durusdinium trenchii]|uniref:Integrase catalytic domain-containing protein n=1 Tax=Durusdinium trenchii TaxID=1381693 RepID=A0ABP0R271_9DINO